MQNFFVLQAITFSLGESVVNVYDNIVSEEDEIVLYVEGYMSNDGSGRSDQVSIFQHHKNFIEMYVQSSR